MADLSTLSKSDYDNALNKLIEKKEFLDALLMLPIFMKYYPEEKIRLEELKEKIEEIYYKSDEGKKSRNDFSDLLTGSEGDDTK